MLCSDDYGHIAGGTVITMLLLTKIVWEISLQNIARGPLAAMHRPIRTRRWTNSAPASLTLKFHSTVPKPPKVNVRIHPYGVCLENVAL